MPESTSPHPPSSQSQPLLPALIPSTPPPTTHPHHPLPHPSSHHSKSIFSCLSLLLLFFFALVVLVHIRYATRISSGLLLMFLALLPTFVYARLILRSFPDPAVSNRFLFLQFLLSAIPIWVLVLFIELISIAIFLGASFVFSFEELKSIGDTLLANKDLQSDPNNVIRLFTQALERLFKPIPIWAILIILVIGGSLSIGIIEEFAKWLVSRRYWSVFYQAVLSGTPRISARGILASACMSGLGLATTENIVAVMSLEWLLDEGLLGTTVLVCLACYRGMAANVFHIGAQLYVAIAAAQNHLFRDGESMYMALLKAILFHALHNAIVFFGMIWIPSSQETRVSGILLSVFVMNAVLVALLGVFGVLVRGRYRALVERELSVTPTCELPSTPNDIVTRRGFFPPLKEE